MQSRNSIIPNLTLPAGVGKKEIPGTENGRRWVGSIRSIIGIPPVGTKSYRCCRGMLTGKSGLALGDDTARSLYNGFGDLKCEVQITHRKSCSLLLTKLRC